MISTVSIESLVASFCALYIWFWYISSGPYRRLSSAGDTWSILGPWESLFRGRKILYQAYRKQLDNDRPYILYGIFGNSILLPPSMLPWLQSQPETHLSAKWAQMDALNIPETFLRPEIGLNPVHEPLVRRELNARLDHIASLINEEVGMALDELWGTETEGWKEVNLDFTIRRGVARATNRILVGGELCRNLEYIEDSIRYVTQVSTYGLFMNLFPTWLKYPIARFCTIPIKATYSKCSKHLLPVFKDLVYNKESSSSDLFSSWLVSNSESYPPTSPERTPDFLSRRIMALNFAAIHTSTLTACNLFLDVFSQPTTVSFLRDEAVASAAHWKGTWNRARLNQMVQLDSAMRESLRLWGVVSKAMTRKVMHPDGLTLPNRQHLPCGATVCVSGWGMHHDESIYPKPFEFVPDRFLRASLQVEQLAGGVQAAAAETDQTFATWGIGKHACPGRFFAVDLIKIIMMHVLLHYEVKPLVKRPENVWIEYNVIPSPAVTLSIKRINTSASPGKTCS